MAVAISCVVFGRDRKADLAVFLKAGSQVWRGVNPYQEATSPLLLDGHAFVYPWLSAWLFAPLSLLPRWLAANAFTLLSVVAVVAGARLLRVPRGWAVAALLLCAPFARNAELGAVNACFFFLLAALWHWRHRTWIVAGSVTLLVGVKLFLAPIVLWVMLTRSWRCTTATCAALAVFFTCSFALGPISPATYFGMLHRLSDYMGHRGMGFESAVAHFFPSSPARAVVLIVVSLGLALSLGSYFRGARRNEAGLLGSLVILSVLASPMLWRHYLLLLFFVLALVRPSTKALLGAATASWVIVGSATIPPLGGLNLDQRFLSLYLLVAILFFMCVKAQTAPAAAGSLTGAGSPRRTVGEDGRAELDGSHVVEAVAPYSPGRAAPSRGRA